MTVVEVLYAQICTTVSFLNVGFFSFEWLWENKLKCLM